MNSMKHTLRFPPIHAKLNVPYLLWVLHLYGRRKKRRYCAGYQVITSWMLYYTFISFFYARWCSFSTNRKANPDQSCSYWSLGASKKCSQFINLTKRSSTWYANKLSRCRLCNLVNYNKKYLWVLNGGEQCECEEAPIWIELNKDKLSSFLPQKSVRLVTSNSDISNLGYLETKLETFKVSFAYSLIKRHISRHFGYLNAVLPVLTVKIYRVTTVIREMCLCLPEGIFCN